MKKILIGLIVIFLLFVAVLVAIPYFFKDRIVDYAKTTLNEQLDADADFETVSLSMLRSFPDLEINLNNLTVKGNAPFEGTTLADIKKLTAAVNLKSLVMGDAVEVTKVMLKEPKIHLKVLKSGKANWDIVKDDTEGAVVENETGGDYKVALKKYGVQNGEFTYEDVGGNMLMEMKGFNHEGKGDFTQEQFNLETKSTAETLSFYMDNIPYLKKLKAKVDANFEVNMDQMKFSFLENKMMLNDLQANMVGSVAMPNDNINVDVQFNSPDTQFKHLLSILPNIYTKDYEKMDVTGEMSFSGFAKGVYNEKSYPAFQVKTNVKDGRFQYPGLPLPVENIQANLDVASNNGNLDNTVINMPQMSFSIDGQPMEIRAIIENPTTDPNFDMAAVGQLDFEKLAKAYPLEGVKQLTGRMDANVKAKGKMSDIEKEQYQNVNVDGTVDIEDMIYDAEGLPKSLDLKKISMNFTPKKVLLNQLEGRIGNSDFKGEGALTDFLGYFLGDDVLKGNLSMNSNVFDVNEWLTETGEAVDSTAVTDSVAMAVFEVPEKVDISISGSVGKILYDRMTLTKASGNLQVKDETVYINNLKANMLEGVGYINGSYSTKGKGKPKFAFNNDLRNIDIKETFKHINSFKILAPIAQFLSGKITTEISLDGDLNDDMFPDISSLSGDGLASLLQGTLVNFEPVTKIANELQIDKLKKIDIVNLKTFFSFKDGRVEVKPFNFTQEDIDFNVAGSHGFDQTLAYDIEALVPSSILGASATSMINSLINQVKGQGINLEMPETVPVKLRLGGTIKNPKIETDFGEVFGNASNAVKDKAKMIADSLKNVAAEKAKATMDSFKIRGEKEAQKLKEEAQEKAKKELDAAKKKAQEEADKLKAKAKEEADKAKEKVGEKAKESINNATKGAGDKIKESIGGDNKELKEQADSLGNKIKDGLKGILKGKDN